MKKKYQYEFLWMKYNYGHYANDLRFIRDVWRNPDSLAHAHVEDPQSTFEEPLLWVKLFATSRVYKPKKTTWNTMGAGFRHPETITVMIFYSMFSIKTKPMAATKTLSFTHTEV